MEEQTQREVGKAEQPAPTCSLPDLLKSISSAYESRAEPTHTLDARHHSEGWKYLEKSLLDVEQLLVDAKTRDESCYEPALFTTLQTSFTHDNRFVKQAAFQVYNAAFQLMSSAQLVEQGQCIAANLCIGLADNWSQVRMVASKAARSFLLNLPDEQKPAYHSMLLPRLCLNRHYVAEGVRNYSLETWKLVVGNNGKQMIVTYIKEFVEFYINQADADNHAVREAACTCICELATRVDNQAVRPFATQLLECLMVAFLDQCWPVRDTAAVACGHLVSGYPEECKAHLEELFKLWFTQLSDDIPSVRANAAVALGEVLQADISDVKTRVKEFLLQNISSLEQQKDDPNLASDSEFQEAKRVADNDEEMHTNKTMYSCGSLAPKMAKGSKVAVGGCSCAVGIQRSNSPWMVSDGCIYLLKEFVKLAPEDECVGKVLEKLPELMRHRFTHCERFWCTVWTQLASLCSSLPKQKLKKILRDARTGTDHLENLLPYLEIAIKHPNRLTQDSAVGFIEALVQNKIYSEDMLRQKFEAAGANSLWANYQQAAIPAPSPFMRV